MLSTLSKSFIGLASVSLVVLLAGFVFLYHLVKKSTPVTDGLEQLTGLHGPVDVYRDEYGVPHIKASDQHDLMSSLGYVHAQDRLWQMDLMRRAGEGRLSELFGSTTVDADKLFRTLDLRDVARRMESNLHSESREILQSYADGVNAFIASHRGEYPIEFDMLDYAPEPWTVEHSLLVVRLLAWELNLSWWTDLTYGEIASKVQPGLLREIIPTYPDSVRPTVLQSQLRSMAESVREFKNANRNYRELFSLGSLESGSNAWAIDSSKSLSGRPLLACDPHLAIPAPARWYLAHLVAPGWNVSGVTVPGVPVIVIGHNENVAWGLTNAMIDDADFYIESVDSNRLSYQFKGESLLLQRREETIQVRDSDSISFVAYSTHHGPLIGSVHPGHRHEDSASHSSAIAMRWTGLDVSDEVYGFILLNRATDARSFTRGLKEITVPSQAVVYADVSGTIAYWTAGHVPIRLSSAPPLMPFQGATGEGEWKGFIPFEQLPRLIDPAEGFIACSNQPIAGSSYPYYLSTLWEPSSRIQRIRTLLESTSKFSPEDFKQFQQDVVSPFASEVTREILHAFGSDSSTDPYVQSALNYLRNWDYRFTQNDVPTSIFNVFFTSLIHNTFEDEMGKDLLNDFVFFGAIPYRVTHQLLAADSSLWFDDITTAARETKQEILRKSLSDAVSELRTTIGDEMKTWQWGTLHTVTFKHPFGSRKPLDKIFNLGPFPVDGGGTTLNKCEYKFTLPYGVAVGPSMRQVVDLAAPLNSFTVITSGQSGQPLSKHYDDQVALWRNGGYLSVTLDWNEVSRSDWDHLVLKPAN